MNPLHKWFGRIALATSLLAAVAVNVGCHDDDQQAENASPDSLKKHDSGGGGDDASNRGDLASLRQENQTLRQMADNYRKQLDQLRIENDQLRSQAAVQRASTEAMLRRAQEATINTPAPVSPTVQAPPPGLVVPPPARTGGAERAPISVYDPPEPAPYVPAPGATTLVKPTTRPVGHP